MFIISEFPVLSIIISKFINNKSMRIFSERLVKTLKEIKMTQAELAEKIGMSPQTVSDYCKDKTEPAYEILVHICKIVGESSDYLLGLEED